MRCDGLVAEVQDWAASLEEVHARIAGADGGQLALPSLCAGENEWRADHRGIAFGETRHYVDAVLHARDIYAKTYADELGLD